MSNAELNSQSFRNDVSLAKEVDELKIDVDELKALKSTCLVNAVGTGAPHETVVDELPSVVGVGTRLVLPNPFGINTPVDVEVQAYLNNKWGKTGWLYSNNQGYGISGGWVQGEGVIVQTGNMLCGWSAAAGGTHDLRSNIGTPTPVRVFVTKLGN